jgi:uncharacterized protein (TIGR03000 family)
MYSVILAALITTGAEQTQGWHHCHGCHSCYSCGCCSCYGGCWCSCGGYAFVPSCSCYGCSCYSSCSCYGCCSCYCSGPGLWTAEYSHWCTGCYGSWCSGYAGTGWSYYSGPTCAGGVCSGDVCSGGAVYGVVASAPSYDYARASTSAPAVARAPVAPTPSTTQTVATRIAPAASPAKVVVNIPEDAKLWVEEVACPLTGETRTFNTAALEPGNRYFYNLTVESPQGTRETRRVELAPGRTTEVDFRAVATVKR